MVKFPMPDCPEAPRPIQTAVPENPAARMTAIARLRLMIMPMILGVADALATLRCQPAEYWDGYGFEHLIEANPIARLVLGIHPLLLIPGFAGWFVVMHLLMFRPPAWIGLRCHVILVTGPLIGLTGAALRFAEHPWARIFTLMLLTLPAVVFFFRPFLPQWNSKLRLRTS